MIRTSFLRAGLMLVGLSVAPLSDVRAQGILQQGFNNPSLASYPAGSFSGNATIQTSAYGVVPTEGTGQALLTTFNGTEIPSNLTGSNGAVTAGVLETFLGLTGGTLTGLGAVEGSAFKSQPLTLNVGDRVTFDYLFLTSEDNTVAGFHNDFSFVTANGQYLGTNPLANVTGANDGSNATNFDFQAGTAYATRSINITTAGTYVFGIGVVDVTNGAIQSGLLVDNLRVVPEPGSLTLALLAAGGLGVGGALRVRRRRSAVA